MVAEPLGHLHDGPARKRGYRSLFGGIRARRKEEKALELAGRRSRFVGLVKGPRTSRQSQLARAAFPGTDRAVAKGAGLSFWMR